MESPENRSIARGLDSLTEVQRQAVCHLDGPQLILAGPGSGKTRVVTGRIIHLLHRGVPPWQILGLTFTNKAAEEMRDRIRRSLPAGDSETPRVWISTFHRFCSHLLRTHAPLVGLEPNFTIYDTADSGRLLRNILESTSLRGHQATPERIAAVISDAKNRLIAPVDYEPKRGSTIGHVVAEIYPRYQQRLLAANAVDFDDLLMHVALLLRECDEVRRQLDARYRYILVDEYQDTNLAQYLIVRSLSIDYPNLSVTGDPDQAIYGWRGANLKNILDFEHDYPGVSVVRLEQNYRSTKAILRAADSLISHNLRRKKKSLFTENDEGAPVRYVEYATHESEAGEIAGEIVRQMQLESRSPGDFAILYRTNALSRQLEHAMAEAGVPYRILSAVQFYQRKEIRDVLAYLRLLHNPRDDVAIRRVINTPVRGIGKTTIDRLAEHAQRFDTSLLEAARQCGLVESISGRSAVAVARFVALFDRISVCAMRSVEEIISRVLTESGYTDALKASDAGEDQDRLANVQELITAARQFDQTHPGDGHLEAFLEQTSLVADTDDLQSSDSRVTLLTMHSAKGLEFPVVYVVAVEQGLVPHERSREDADSLEEERRLLFVSMTRAQQRLQLSSARVRDYRGQRKYTVPSPFLHELPTAELEIIAGMRGASMREPVDFLAEYASQSTAPEMDEARYQRPQEPPASEAPRSRRQAPRLTTAAALGGSEGGTPRAARADNLRAGMLVRHAEYGIGKIGMIEGRGERKQATVHFVTGAGTKKFVLSQCKLEFLSGP